MIVKVWKTFRRIYEEGAKDAVDWKNVHCLPSDEMIYDPSATTGLNITYPEVFVFF